MIETYKKVSDLFSSTSAILKDLSTEELLGVREPLLKLSAGVEVLISEMDKHGEHIQSDLDAAYEERDSIQEALQTALISG